MEKIKAPTRKEMFTAVSDFLAQHDADTDLIDFVNHQIELLDNKKENKKQAKEQEENAAYSDAIYEQMALNLIAVMQANFLTSLFHQKQMDILIHFPIGFVIQ